MSGIPDIQPYSMPTPSELPKNIATWKIDPKRVVLLVHDMQQYFVKRIPHENPKAALIKNISLIKNRCEKLNIPVAFTAQNGGMTDSERGLLKYFWGSGMKVDREDRRIIEELTPSKKNWMFSKWRYSAFYKSDLLRQIRESQRDQLIICGVYAHIGVLCTAIDSFSHDIQTFLVPDAIADFSKTHHHMALNYAAQCCSVNVFSYEILV
jgi:isochorismate hydrolase